MNQRTKSFGPAAAVAALAAVGNALLAVAHTGIEVPLLSALGPAGGAVPPAVAAFSVGTVLFAVIAWGLWSGRRWARPLALAVSVLAVLSGIGQFRGVVSAAGIILAVLLAALLLRPERSAT